jgi:hypothetical protein
VCALCAASTCKSRPLSDGSTVCATSDVAQTPLEAGPIKRGLACFDGKVSSQCAEDVHEYMAGTGCMGNCEAQVLVWGDQNNGCGAASRAACTTTPVTPVCVETADGTPSRIVCHLFVTAR